jgi:DNA-binding HxlR family transcriptional regulator
MYILWILRSQGAMRFGALKRQVEGISTKVLTERLRMLEAEGLIYRDYVPTVPPQVTYGLTERMKDLTEVLDQLSTIAQRWYSQEAAEAVPQGPDI